jgi:hypothetical protein
MKSYLDIKTIFPCHYTHTMEIFHYHFILALSFAATIGKCNHYKITVFIARFLFFIQFLHFYFCVTLSNLVSSISSRFLFCY